MSLILDTQSVGSAKAQFINGTLLPDLAYTESFFVPSVYAELAEEIRKSAKFETWCVQSVVGEDHAELRSGFREPLAGQSYGTIREMTRQPPSILAEIAGQLGDQEHLTFLSESCQVELRRLQYSSELASWGPGSFAAAHTDFDHDVPVKLVINLSLANDWHESYGGQTCYWQASSGRCISILPTPNAAALLRPRRNAFHWVNQVAPSAPDHSRIGWVLTFS